MMKIHSETVDFVVDFLVNFFLWVSWGLPSF